MRPKSFFVNMEVFLTHVAIPFTFRDLLAHFIGILQLDNDDLMINLMIE